MRKVRWGALLICLSLAGCSSTMGKLSRWMGLEEEKTAPREPASVETADDTSTAEAELIKGANGQPNLGAGEFAPQQRLFDEKAQMGYRRNGDPWQATGNYNEASLWNPDTQENYLFTRNMVNKVGDFVMIRIEADLQESLNTKLTALYKPQNTKPKLKDTIAEEAGKAAGDKVGDAVEKAIGNKNIADAARSEVQDRTVAAIADKNRFFTTKELPVRIVEVNNRGVLKVEGVKKLFLKNGNFDLKVSGMLREEDIGPSRMVASSRIMDQKVEIVK